MPESGSRFTVVVTDHYFEDLSIERDALDDIADVVMLSEDPERSREQLARADALVNMGADVDADAIAQLDDCRVIARYGIGVDNIDALAAAERGIPVTNIPDYCIEEVATHTIALLLALARRLKPYDSAVAAGEWKPVEVAPITARVSSQTVGIVGFGAIGRAVCERAAALGLTVLAHDPYLEPADLADDPATLVPFETLLERADFVTVHTPLTEETRGMFDAATFERMKAGACFLNAARGPIMHEDALLAALAEGRLAGAGLDVFSEEPPDPGNPLLGRPDVIATPHMAWYSEEADLERRHEIARIVRAALVDEPIPNVVNGVTDEATGSAGG